MTAQKKFSITKEFFGGCILDTPKKVLYEGWKADDNGIASIEALGGKFQLFYITAISCKLIAEAASINELASKCQQVVLPNNHGYFLENGRWHEMFDVRDNLSRKSWYGEFKKHGGRIYNRRGNEITAIS